MHKLFNKNFKQYTPLAHLPKFFLLGIAAVPREIEIMLMQIFGGVGVGGANKVHCGICASGLSSP